MIDWFISLQHSR